MIRSPIQARTRFPLAALLPLLAGAAGLLSTAAQAQAQGGPAASAPIHVQAQRDEAPRRDLSRVCPEAHTELPEALASAYRDVATSGTVRVRLAFEGSKIVAVQPLDGPRRYHRYLRTAVYDMTCSADKPGRQVFEFAVRFADPAEAAGSRVALLTR